jgi:hypothetical protein
MLAHQSGPPWVVIMVNQIILQIALARGDQPQGKFAIRAEDVFQKGVTEQRSLSKGFSSEVVPGSQARR